MAKKTRITVLQPEADVPLERFENWLRSRLRVTTIELWAKDVPNLDTIGDGLLVLGGRMSAHDDEQYRWMGEVKDLLADAQGMDLPVLGICLGHQLLADALGGEVTVGDERGPEEGPVELEWLAGALDDPVLGGTARLGGPVPMSHHDTVTRLPEGAVELARSATHGNAAFRLGSAVGVQHHPEASPELMQYWWKKAHGGNSTAMLDRMRAVDEQVTASSRALAYGFVDEVLANA